MTVDEATNVLIPIVALGVVIYSAFQLVRRRDRSWPVRSSQLLISFGIFALSTNLIFGRNFTFAMLATRATEVCCLAGGILIVVAMLANQDLARN
ncbi:MAG TPA: hypothetical protein VGM20_12890 [Gemmatimonadales bacterium]|jgi:hypothetical protein